MIFSTEGQATIHSLSTGFISAENVEARSEGLLHQLQQGGPKWAVWIKAVLEAAGFTVVMQASDFGPGRNFVIEMHQAVSETKRMIAVLSPDYLKRSLHPA